MKIYVNREPIVGPYGGGNRVLSAICSELNERKHIVAFRPERDIDLIFCMDPRRSQSGVEYSHLERMRDAFGCPILQRVGDVGTHGKPDLTHLLKKTVQESDIVVYPSEWAREQISDHVNNSRIIKNKPVGDFYLCREKRDNTSSIFTHHWSDNRRKGFELYQSLDRWSGSENFTFTFMGRVPQGINLSRTVSPGTTDQIIHEMKNHGIYVTASEEEAGANHVLEAMAAGLPIVYRSSGGSIVEYCKDFGIQYTTEEELKSALVEVRDNYDFYSKRVEEFDGTVTDTAKEYVDLMESMC